MGIFNKIDSQFSIMKITYHCLPCNKEFVDMQMAKEHIDSTGHEFMERQTLKGIDK